MRETKISTMRKTILNGSFASPGIIRKEIDDPETFLGINFGFDVVPEHVRGLRPMWDALGVPHNLVPENFGLKMYKTTIFPRDRFFFQKGATHTCLTFEPGTEELKGWENEELDNAPEQLAIAWDEKSFGIVVPNMYFTEINALYEAFERKDVLVQFNLNQTYVYPQRPYLWISIFSQLSPEEEKKAFEVHKKRYEEESKQPVEIA
jgi:hypothetical protein